MLFYIQLQSYIHIWLTWWIPETDYKKLSLNCHRFTVKLQGTLKVIGVKEITVYHNYIVMCSYDVTIKTLKIYIYIR